MNKIAQEIDKLSEQMEKSVKTLPELIKSLGAEKLKQLHKTLTPAFQEALEKGIRQILAE